MDGGRPPVSLGRRTLLQGATCAGALCAVGQSLGCAPRIDAPPAIQTGPLEGNLARVELSRVPELYDVGGSIVLEPEAYDENGQRLALLVVNAGGTDGYRAYTAYCTHAQCLLAWDGAAREVVCPCHLSRFALDGNVLSRPATDPLDAYPVSVDAAATATLSIDLGGNAGIFPTPVAGKISFTAALLAANAARLGAPVPDLSVVGGSATGRSQGLRFPIVVVRTGARTAVAYDARCTHQNCKVTGGATSLLCACHNSVFSVAKGTPLSGPAREPLRAKPCDLSDGTTFVVTVA